MPTPLHAAIRADDEREALRHVALGAVVVRVFDDDGNTPLALAAARGQLTLVGALLDAHARVNARDAGDDRSNLYRTPLACAIGEGQYETAELLLERGARRDLTDRLGMSPLAIAVARDDVRCIRLLIEGRARPGSRAAGMLNVEATLLDAAFHRPAAVTAALLEGRLGPRAQATRLVHAASTLDVAGVQSLLEAGVSPDARGHGGWSALGAAIASGPSVGAPPGSRGALADIRPHELVRRRVLTVMALLDAGASPQVPAIRNTLPVQVAREANAPAEILERVQAATAP